MTETINGKTILTTPITEADVRALHSGDIVFLSGDLVTGRDDVHMRAVREGLILPEDIRGMALMHAGPIVRTTDDGAYEMISIGPTTSMRMEKLEYVFIEKTGVRFIIGKGGMSSKTAEACRSFEAVHCVLPAGNAVFTALCVDEIKDVGWLDLGMAEAFWHLRVRNLGPLIVSIDISGRNIFEEKKRDREVRKNEQLEIIGERLKTFL